MLTGTVAAGAGGTEAIAVAGSEQYVAVEWPQMADGQGTISVAPGGLVQVQDVVLSLPVRTEGERVAEDRLVTAVDAALEARRTRLVLSGSADTVCPPEIQAELAAAIPGAVHVTIVGAGHMSPLDHPAAVADAHVEHAVEPEGDEAPVVVARVAVRDRQVREGGPRGYSSHQIADVRVR